MKKIKISPRLSKNRSVIIALTALIVIVFTFIYVYKFAANRQIMTDKSDTRPKVENVLSLEGRVTLIKSSCGAKSIDPEEDLRRYSICDSGKALRIDEKIIHTSSGGAGRGFGVDVTWAKLGDKVSVKYVNDKEYGPSLNCSECSVTVFASEMTY